ncbi:hypothetical protein ALI144C_08390 [Actinosynnema sp. ALI-1.44]|nr:hypothetical protein ALI144C_08390 [Actinosynnema sp. ALI-1.44]
MVRMNMDDKLAPNVFLSGGSAQTIADADRLRYVPDLDVPKVSLLFGNRYEHFEASSETTLVDGREVKVFVWSLRTYVAE